MGAGIIIMKTLITGLQLQALAVEIAELTYKRLMAIKGMDRATAMRAATAAGNKAAHSLGQDLVIEDSDSSWLPEGGAGLDRKMGKGKIE
jgi:hypothetical protein